MDAGSEELCAENGRQARAILKVSRVSSCNWTREFRANEGSQKEDRKGRVVVARTSRSPESCLALSPMSGKNLHPTKTSSVQASRRCTAPHHLPSVLSILISVPHPCLLLRQPRTTLSTEPRRHPSPIRRMRVRGALAGRSTADVAVTELMKPKHARSPPASPASSPRHKRLRTKPKDRSGLGAYIERPEAFPASRVVQFDADFVVIRDLYPKSR